MRCLVAYLHSCSLCGGLGRLAGANPPLTGLFERRSCPPCPPSRRTLHSSLEPAKLTRRERFERKVLPAKPSTSVGVFRTQSALSKTGRLKRDAFELEGSVEPVSRGKQVYRLAGAFLYDQGKGINGDL